MIVGVGSRGVRTNQSEGLEEKPAGDVYDNLQIIYFQKKKGLFLLIFQKASMFSLDITMLSMAAYQNIDDICDGFNLDRDQITLVRLLGTGNFGHVSKAIYGASHSEVAVKSLKGSYIFCFFQLTSFNLIIVHKPNFCSNFSY